MTDADLARLCAEAYTATPDISGNGPFRGTHAIVRSVESYRVIAFRGTDDPSDWLADLMAMPVLSYDKRGLKDSCFVHRGFMATALSIYGEIEIALISEKPFILAGHSLGGALALVTALLAIRRGYTPAQVVTFGAPRVGFAAFSDALIGTPVRQYRRGNDPVPSVPIALRVFPYLHAREPLIAVGKRDESDPFACHHIAGYAADVLAYLDTDAATKGI